MISSPASFVRLSTSQFEQHDRIDAAREVFGRTIIKVEFEPRPDVPFNMDMVLRSLPDFGLASGARSAMDCLHTAPLIDSDDLVLTVALSGAGAFHFHGRETEIERGAATLVRSSGAGCMRIHTNSQFISLRFPFHVIAPLISDLDAALVRPIPASSESLRLLVHYAGVLRDEDALGTAPMRRLVAAQLRDLAALTIGATRDAAAVAGAQGVRAARLRAIKADIDENLASHQFSINAVAARHGISPRYVSKLFEDETETFSEYVLGRRLDRAHRMLSDPRLDDRSVSAIAFESGFGDLSYFNRVFRRAYGATPSDVRAQSRRDGD